MVATYMRMRAGTPYFRMRVPNDLISRFRVSEVSINLGHCGVRRRRWLLSRCAHRVQEFMAQARADVSIGIEELRAVMGELRSICDVADVRVRMTETMLPSEIDAFAERITADALQGRYLLPDALIEPAVGRARDVSSSNGNSESVTVSAVQQAWTRMLVRELHRAAPSVADRTLPVVTISNATASPQINAADDELEGLPAEVPAKPGRGSTRIDNQEPRTTKATATISDQLFSAYAKERTDNRLAEKTIRPSTHRSVMGTVDLWIRLIADKPTHEYVRADAISFRRQFLALPADYKNLSELRPARDDEKLCTGATLNKHLSNLRGLFDYARKELDDRVPKGLFDDLAAKKRNRRTRRHVRSKFTAKQIHTLFSSPHWTGRASDRTLAEPGDLIIRDDFYWAVAVIALSGMRRGEACVLRLGDVVNKDGVWIFDLRPHDTKTIESQREVPIHQGLIDLGFLDHVREQGRDPSERIFATFPTTQNDPLGGDALGKRFVRYVEAIGLRTDKKLCLHSLRGTVITLLTQVGVGPDLRDELMGHTGDETSDVTRSYFGEFELDALQGAMNRLDYGVDFIALRRAAEADGMRPSG